MSSKQINSIDDVKNLFSSSVNDGDMSSQMSQIAINGLNDSSLTGCMGASIDDLSTDDVTLVSLIMDASISMATNQSAVRASFDELIAALKESKQAPSMLVSSRTFHTTQKILYGFKKVEEIDKIGTDYTANGDSTALYDAIGDAIIGIRAYSKYLIDNGIRVRHIVVAMSDGGDNDSRNFSANDIKQMSLDCLKSEMFYLAYIGYGPGLDRIADEVGFPNKLTTGATASEIRKTMGVVSKSIIRASQTKIGASNSFFS